jgi:ABC-type Fe3+-siderophore transport system permease subunit
VLLPLSVLAGAVFMLSLDLAQYALLGDHVLQPGVAMSLVGGPFFLVLLMLNRREFETW